MCLSVHLFYDKFFRPLQCLLLSVSLLEPEKSFHFTVSPFLSFSSWSFFFALLCIFPAAGHSALPVLKSFLSVSSECVYSGGYFNCFPSSSLCKHQHWISPLGKSVFLLLWNSLLAFIFTIMNSTRSPATQQYDNPLLWTVTNWQQPAAFADSKHPQEHTRMWSSALCMKC